LKSAPFWCPNKWSERRSFLPTPAHWWLGPNPQPVEFYTLVISDDPTLNLFVVDGYGDFSDISGAGGYSVELLIGRINETAVAAQATWSGITNGWTADLDLETVELLALLGDETEIEAFAQVTITDPDARPRTYAQQRIRIENRILSPGSGTPTPIEDYLTSAQTYDRFVQNRSAITGLTGGGVLNLDGITTLTKGPGWIVAVMISGGLKFYQLQAGTDAESSPDVIRPDDYTATTNEKVWRLLNRVRREAGDPNTLGIIGETDGQLYINTLTGTEKWNWDAVTAFWI